MKRGKNIEKLIEELELYIPMILSKSKDLDDMSNHLFEVHGIDRGVLMKALNNSKRLDSLDDAFLALLAEQISLKVSVAWDSLNLNNWFSESEIDSFRKYLYIEDAEDELPEPLVFEDAIYLGRNAYMVALTISQIGRLFKYNRLTYDYLSQRDARVVIKGGKEKKEPFIVKKNVAEMVELESNSDLEKTTLAFNCLSGSSKDPSGVELVYDHKTKQLTITEGTRIDIMDGAHRINAYYLLYKENPNNDEKIPVLIRNYTPRQAQKFQVQLSKQTPFTNARIIQLESKTLCSTLVNQLNSEEALENKIATNIKLASPNYIVHSDDLILGFEILWQPVHPMERDKIKKLFNEYVNYLKYYAEEKNMQKTMLMDRKLFIGHIALARKMHENNIPYENLSEIIDNNDWSNNNPKLIELKKKFVDRGNSNRPVMEIGKYFDSLLKGE